MEHCVPQVKWLVLWCVLESFRKLLSIQLLPYCWEVIRGHWTLSCCIFEWTWYLVEISAAMVGRDIWSTKVSWSPIPVNGNYKVSHNNIEYVLVLFIWQFGGHLMIIQGEKKFHAYITLAQVWRRKLLVSFKYLSDVDVCHFFSGREEAYSDNLILFSIYSSDLAVYNLEFEGKEKSVFCWL